MFATWPAYVPSLICPLQIHLVKGTHYENSRYVSSSIYLSCPVLLSTLLLNILSLSSDNDQLDAHLLYFTIRPLQSTTCFKHYMLIIRRMDLLMLHLESSAGISLVTCWNPRYRVPLAGRSSFQLRGVSVRYGMPILRQRTCKCLVCFSEAGLPASLKQTKHLQVLWRNISIP